MEILTVLKDISEINFSGNIIPHNWYKHVTYSTAGGKTKADLLAINILADVVYWHRLTEIRDEATGKIIKYDKKFNGDKLQKSYDSYADQFGSTKRAVKDSVDLLVNLKLIQRDFEDIKVRGLCLNNVMFLTPIPENIKVITQIVSDLINTLPSPECTSPETVVLENCTPSYEKTREGKKETKLSLTSCKNSEGVLRNFVGVSTEISDTNTEISFKSSSEINTKSYLIVRGAEDDLNFIKAFQEFLVDDSYKYRTDTFFWINHNAEKWGSSLDEVTQALKICADKQKEGEIDYLTGILRKKAEAKGQGYQGFGKRTVFAIYDYLKFRLKEQMEYISNYDLNMDQNILYYSIRSREDKEPVEYLFGQICENIKSEFNVTLQPQLRL
jgi:hypothetical protein